MKKLFLLVFTIAAYNIAAAAGGAQGDHYIPMDKIGWQAANLGILLLIIYFGIKKSIVETFKKRRQDFLDQSEKTKAALNAAENELKDIKSRMVSLEGGETKAMENAKHEANLIKAHMIKDAEALALKMKTDAELSIQAELSRARSEINAIILNEAVSAAKQKLIANAPNSNKGAEGQFLNQVDNAGAAKVNL